MAEPPVAPQAALQALPSLSERGKYVVGERLATGGMAEVYKGWLRGSEGFRRPVVIKKMLPRLASDPRFVRMFIEEARLASRLVHANIVQVLDFGRVENEHFIVLEFIDGPNLNELILKARQAGTKRLPLSIVVYIIAETLKGLDHAHRLTDSRGERLGCVHRDVTPSNILVSRDGQVKLSDFGVARAQDRSSWTAPGQIRGKLHYLSPEQVRGETVDPRADLFAVGVLLHELLCGRRLFGGDTPMAIMEATLSGPVPPPSTRAHDVPGELDQVALTALQRNPDDRFPDAETFLQALMKASIPHFSPGRSRDLVALLDRYYGPPLAVAEDPLAALLESQPSAQRLDAGAESAADRTRPMMGDDLANLALTQMEMPAAPVALAVEPTVPVQRPVILLAAQDSTRRSVLHPPVAQVSNVHPPVAMRDDRPRPATPIRVATPMPEPSPEVPPTGEWSLGGPTAPDGHPAEQGSWAGTPAPGAGPRRRSGLLLTVALLAGVGAGVASWLLLGS